MNDSKKKILINLLVICLYFIWPYFLSGITNLFGLTKTVNLYVSFSFNFVFLGIVIYIYKGILKDYCNKLNKNFKANFLFSLKIFLVGLGVYVLVSILLGLLDIPILGNQGSMKEIAKKIPIIFILNTLFYYPVIEELIFKMSFKEIFKYKWSFIIITGVFNALFQIVFSFNNLTDLLYLLPYSIFFGSLAYVYYKTDNIMYPIILRICYNLIPCIIYIRNLFY